jgi:hypothetical protein
MGSGYLLNFSDRTFQEFVADSVGRDIYDSRYNYASGSKANRMRGFWKEEGNRTVLVVRRRHFSRGDLPRVRGSGRVGRAITLRATTSPAGANRRRRRRTSRLIRISWSAPLFSGVLRQDASRQGPWCPLGQCGKLRVKHSQRCRTLHGLRRWAVLACGSGPP